MAYQSICVALLFLLIGHMMAEPEIESANRKTHMAPCQEHSTLNDRLDAVEKRVEETVQKLEAELAVLLNNIQAPDWSSIVNTDTAGPTVDILNENSNSPHS